MNSDLLRRSAIGALTTGTDAAWDYYLLNEGGVDPATRNQLVASGAAGGLLGNFAGQGLSMWWGLAGNGKRGILGDLLTTGTSIAGSLIGNQVAKNRQVLEQTANQYKSDALLL